MSIPRKILIGSGIRNHSNIWEYDKMPSPIIYAMFGLYAIASVGLFTYGINCYWLLALFLKNKRKEGGYDRRKIRRFYAEDGMNRLPMVTTQSPVYNEANVIERLIRSVCAME